MGDKGEPGSPSRQIIQAALMAGMGVAVCTCDGKEDSHRPGFVHDLECSMGKARQRMRELLASKPAP